MQKRRILLVEDEEPLLRVYKRILEQAGYAVDGVGDAVEALKRAKNGEYDIVVSDITLPRISGLDLLRASRARDPEAPVILITGRPAIETAVEAVEHGAFRYLTKPFSVEQFLDTVAQAGRLRDLATLKRQALALTGKAAPSPDERSRLNAQLDSALASLWLAFQPVIAAKEGKVIAYESLMRTREASMRGPDAVLCAAETLGRLHELGRTIRNAVADSAVRTQVAWLLVNLHPEDLLDEMLYQRSAPLSRVAGSVILEVTERISLDDVPNVRQRVGSLRAMGYRVAIDDLGAGYAGLSSFAHLDPEIIKLDMSLIRNVHRDPARERLVRGMIALCHDLGKLVIGEGVERTEERDVLVDAGCDYLQGYLFAKPSPEFCAVS